MKLKDIILKEDQESFKYRGIDVLIHQDSDEFYWINYDPPLPKEIDKKYNKASYIEAAADKAKQAIDLHLGKK